MLLSTRETDSGKDDRTENDGSSGGSAGTDSVLREMFLVNILLFSGTTEGNQIAEFLRAYPVFVYLSVATQYGKTCAVSAGNVEVIEGRMTEDGMETFIRTHAISMVIDATHPFARQVSAAAKMAAEQCGAEYVRCLREASTWEKEDRENLVIVESVREAAQFLQYTEGRVLIATGSKELQEYTVLNDYQNRCYARVLATHEAIGKTVSLGFDASHVIAMQGPFSKEMNIATLRHVGAEWFVTKESGKSGGFEEKLAAAKETGVKLVVVERPQEEGLSLPEVCKLMKKRLVPFQRQ